MMSEGKRLHKLGYAIHWLKANSKQPLESGWTKGERKTWEALEDSYRYGLNIGVRLGRASRFKDGTYLAVIDCDVKGEDPKYLKEMEAALAGLIKEDAPQVTSGRGNGSRHIYVRVKNIRGTFKYTQSPHKVQVLMPSVEPTSHERQVLKAHQLKAGVRLRAAWEISIMGEGGQVVLPPSIHPDTGNTYEWEIPVERWQDIPIIDVGKDDRAAKADMLGGVSDDFKAVDVDLLCSEIPDSTYRLIVEGEGCDDQSAGLFTAIIALTKANFTDNEILSVLTDRSNILGQAAYRHANTTSRKRAALWLAKYTLAKVRAETGAHAHFKEHVVVADLDDDGASKQLGALKKEVDWELKLEREGGKADGKPKVTLKNVMMILRHAVGENVFKFDAFALRASHGMKAPWGASAGDAFQDVDAINIKHWFSEHYRFEPPVMLVWEAMHSLAYKNKFHPICDYLNALPAWDGMGRIDGYLKNHFHASGPAFYLDEVFAKFLVGAVTRVFEPGAKFDWMLILEGDQDIGKSSFIQILASAKYFIDKLPDLADKDAAQALQGIWLVEMGELKELKRNEIETVKGFITRQVDKYRPPYGRATIEAPRQCLFAGSTNADKYLKDDTGNRRFVPVSLKGHLDFARLEEDRDQLWAEALALYRSGIFATGELSFEAKIYLKKLHQSRMTEDDSSVMEERLLDALEANDKKPKNEQFNYRRFKLLDLFSEMGPLNEWKAGGWTSQLAGRALTRLGFESRKSEGRKWWVLNVDTLKSRVTPSPSPTLSPKTTKKLKGKNRDI